MGTVKFLEKHMLKAYVSTLALTAAFLLVLKLWTAMPAALRFGNLRILQRLLAASLRNPPNPATRCTSDKVATPSKRLIEVLHMAIQRKSGTAGMIRRRQNPNPISLVETVSRSPAGSGPAPDEGPA